MAQIEPQLPSRNVIDLDYELIELVSRVRHYEHHTLTLPYPLKLETRNDDELTSALHKLDEDIKILLDDVDRKTYTAVKVLLLNWQNCNLDPDVANETLELQKVLRDEYGFDAGYKTDVFRIPDSNSSLELHAYMSNAILAFDKLQTPGKKLMIVYYNGHGKVKSNELLISGGTQPSISWHTTQVMLESVTTFDILLVLDCCFAARSIKSASATRAMEVLCASSREVVAGLVRGDGSNLTQALLKHIRNPSQYPNGLLISELTHMLHTDPVLSEQSPNHITISGHDRPIVLRPRVQTPPTGQPSQTQNAVLDAPKFFDLAQALSEFVQTLTIYDSDGNGQVLNCIVSGDGDKNFITASEARRLNLTPRKDPNGRRHSSPQIIGPWCQSDVVVDITVEIVSDSSKKRAGDDVSRSSRTFTAVVLPMFEPFAGLDIHMLVGKDLYTKAMQPMKVSESTYEVLRYWVRLAWLDHEYEPDGVIGRPDDTLERLKAVQARISAELAKRQGQVTP